MPRYDIFISYARKDSDWVIANLVKPLQQCRKTVNGRWPVIFFDVGEEGIDIGADWRENLAEAMGDSANIMMVYSFPYFDSTICKYERGVAQTLWERGEVKLYPLLIDPAAENFIPLPVAHINYQKSFDPDWFDKLCNSMRLRAAVPQEQRYLKFLNQPENIITNHTLPPVRVALLGVGEPVSVEEEEVTISCEAGELQGTSTVRTVAGVATFSDLCISQNLASVRLIASVRGLEPVSSRTFAVLSPVLPSAPVAGVSQEVIIKPPGEALFLASGQALAVLREDCSLYDLQAKPLLSGSEEVKLSGRLRLWRSSESLLALAAWSGHCYLLAGDGRCHTFSPGMSEEGFHVPGDLGFAGEDVLVGFWNGTVYRLSLSDGSCRVEFRNETGIQALAVAPDGVYVCGFDGMLRVYRERRFVNSFHLEPAVRLLKKFPESLLAIGEKRLYQIDLVKRRMISEELPLADVVQVWGETELPVIMDRRGKGMRIDADLAIKARFHTTPGATPVSADNPGKYCIFHNPDGLRTLLKGEQIVLTHLGSTFAVTPKGDLFALGDEDCIRLLKAADMESMIEVRGAVA